MKHQNWLSGTEPQRTEADVTIYLNPKVNIIYTATLDAESLLSVLQLIFESSFQ